MNLIRQTILTIGEDRNKPRLWIEGKYLERAGFKKGCNIHVQFGLNEIQIRPIPNGERIVSGKKYPIIDINNEKIRSVFSTNDKVEVLVSQNLIIIRRTKKDERKATQLNDKSVGDVFSGGGIFTEASKQAGYTPKFAIEIEKNYADIHQKNHDGTMYNTCISDVRFDELPKVELLIGGIPCEAFSKARRNDKEILVPEHKTADLSIQFMKVVEACNPKNVILEEVTPYLKSDIGLATITALRRDGYNVETRVIPPRDFGEPLTRSRVIIIASRNKINWPDPTKDMRKVSEILLDPNDPECEWFDKTTKSWVFKRWDDELAKGNNFISQQITTESETIQAITKRYFAQQAGNPVVKQTKEGVFRWFTMTEVRNIFGVPDDYDLGDGKVIAGEVLGQGVLIPMFKKIIEGLIR